MSGDSPFLFRAYPKGKFAIKTLQSSTPPVDATDEVDPMGQRRSVTATPTTQTTRDELAIPVLPQRSKGLSRPSKRYFLKLFFTYSNESASYQKTSRSTDFPKK